MALAPLNPESTGLGGHGCQALLQAHLLAEEHLHAAVWLKPLAPDTLATCVCRWHAHVPQVSTPPQPT